MESGTSAEKQRPNFAELEARYYATNDEATKTEILFEFDGEESRDSLMALGRMFQRETNADLKVEVLDAIASTEGNLEIKLPLLQSAIMRNQPSDLRESAIDALQDVEDARAIPLWQSLLSDPDEFTRETATERIQELQNPPPSKARESTAVGSK